VPDFHPNRRAGATDAGPDRSLIRSEKRGNFDARTQPAARRELPFDQQRVQTIGAPYTAAAKARWTGAHDD